MEIRLIARDSNLSILSTKTQHVIRFLSDAKPGEKPSSKVFQFEEGGGDGRGWRRFSIREAGSFEAGSVSATSFRFRSPKKNGLAVSGAYW